MWSLKRAAAALDADLIGEDRQWSGLEMDTRQLSRPELFVALPGASADGHDFLPGLSEEDASGAIVAADKVSSLGAQALPMLAVESPLEAMQALGVAVRDSFEGRVVGVTGSCGKTTTKELIAAALEPAGEVRASKGNYNNHLGVLMTLAGVGDVQAGVVEIGANAPGEVALLSSWARPDIAVITSIGEAHVEGFGGLEGVARAKSEILQQLDAGALAVLPADTPFVPWLSHRASGARVRWFGRMPGSDASILRTKTTPDLRCEASIDLHGQVVEVSLQLSGSQSALAAAATLLVAQEMGVDPCAAAAAMARVPPAPGRLRPLPLRGGGVLMDDAYNANPMSVRNALELLASQAGPKIAVLGEMAELGEEAAEHHRALGRYARKLEIDQLIAMGGDLAEQMAEGFGKGRRLDAHAEAAEAALALATPAAAVLVKGSRSARMDLVVDALRAPVVGPEGGR